MGTLAKSMIVLQQSIKIPMGTLGKIFDFLQNPIKS